MHFVVIVVVFRIVFPKPETEIVNKILRLSKAIVDPMQIRSNAVTLANCGQFFGSFWEHLPCRTSLPERKFRALAVCNGTPFMVEKISPRVRIELSPLDQ